VQHLCSGGRWSDFGDQGSCALDNFDSCCRYTQIPLLVRYVSSSARWRSTSEYYEGRLSLHWFGLPTEPQLCICETERLSAKSWIAAVHWFGSVDVYFWKSATARISCYAGQIKLELHLGITWNNSE
jgi:hypothetical protein